MLKILVTIMLALVVVACAPTEQIKPVLVMMEPKSDSTATGVIALSQTNDLVTIKIDMTGVSPGMHGFHIHEKGNCSPANASAAGGHFNPSNMTHGNPAGVTRHAGDQLSLEANAQGEIRTIITTEAITLNTGQNSIAGKSFVLHADPDDYTTQPAGNSGKRIACGVIPQ